MLQRRKLIVYNANSCIFMFQALKLREALSRSFVVRILLMYKENVLICIVFIICILISEVLSLTMPLKVKMLILCSKSVINPHSSTRLRKLGQIGHDKSLKVGQYNVYQLNFMIALESENKVYRFRKTFLFSFRVKTTESPWLTFQLLHW